MEYRDPTISNYPVSKQELYSTAMVNTDKFEDLPKGTFVKIRLAWYAAADRYGKDTYHIWDHNGRYQGAINEDDLTDFVL